ncbi:hypothetical protein BH20ACI2_BH20ACI2_14180 [soil metagenome]
MGHVFKMFYSYSIAIKRIIGLFLIIAGGLGVAAGAPVIDLPLRANIVPACELVSGYYPWRFADIYADGNIAVQGSYNCRGVFIYDLTDPDNPVLASHYNPSPTQAFLEATVIGNRGYFASGGPYPSGTADSGDGVHIVDLTNPYQPALLGKVNATNGGYNGVHEMVIQGNYLFQNYNSTSNKVLKIIDISDPTAPVFKWNVVPFDSLWVHAVHVRGNRMYTSGWRGMIEIYDIGNLATQPPTFLGAITGDNNNHTSYTSEDGNYLYSARETYDGDIRVYDVRDPEQPFLVKSIKTSELGLQAISPHDPVVMGDKLYVSWYQAGVQIFDISNPVNPVHVAQYDTFVEEYVAPSALSSVSTAEGDPWDIICGAPGSNLQNVPQASFDGSWAVTPFLGVDKILAGDMTRGLFVIDASSLFSGPEITLSGRVMTPAGGGLRNAQVMLRGPDGIGRTVPTSSMGYYSFDEIAGASYTVSVSSRRYRFEQRSVDLSAPLSEFDFIGLE